MTDILKFEFAKARVNFQNGYGFESSPRLQTRCSPRLIDVMKTTKMFKGKHNLF